MGRLDYESDLIVELTKIAKDNKIRAGKISVIGAVKQATISFYDQEKKEYQDIALTEELEIVSCIGNISLKDGEPIIHAHISLANQAGESFGGHLVPGTIIFAGEYIMEELIGEAFERGHDQTTGLPLWEK